MSTLHLIGSEGFIGRALQREAGETRLHCWSHQHAATQQHFDLLDPETWQALLSSHPELVILLSWPGLPQYRDPIHLTQTLPACLRLLEALIAAGLKRLVVAGTCYEYGLQNGALRVDQPADPVNAYGIAKDALRRFVASRCPQADVRWCWLRIFYPYGPGQNANALLPSLQRAIQSGDREFAMGSGRELRDVLPVEQVARQLLQLSQHPHAQGIFNGGSGQPISLRELVEQRIAAANSPIRLRLGAYPGRPDEPPAFWADMSTWQALMSR